VGDAVSAITLVTWDGGGNVAVTLAIAVALLERGHVVTVAGPRSLRSEIESHSIRYAELGIAPPRDPDGRSTYLLDVAQGDDSLLDRLRQLGKSADLLVIDCNLNWAMESPVAERTAVLVHTALGIYLPVWQAALDMANAQRSARGQPPLATAVEAWARPDCLLVASLEHFDRPLPPGPLRPIYVGPVMSTPHGQDERSSIAAEEGRPRVLVSYSTDRLQNSPRRLQTALDALAALPVSVLATTSGAFPADEVRAPDNATVREYLAVDVVVANAALVLCHAGHGTTMAALTHGVPLVCVPGLGRDQEPIATRVSELGLGIGLPSDATTMTIRHAATTVLADTTYRDRAHAFAQRAESSDGAQRAAAELVAMLDQPLRG
jgi:UDP:flavonoid glycosyltransferase YjiC (YdhE family)